MMLNCRSILKFIIVLGVAMVSVLEGQDKPNIIFILTDDLGIGDIGVFYQNDRRAEEDPAKPSHATPNLDSMAKEGMQLRRHYSAAPVCAPARASLLLGVHQGHANVRNNQFDKALAENHTLATVLREGGYVNACIGKWGLQGEPTTEAPDWPAHPLNRGFDYYYGYMRHVDGHEHYPKEGLYRGRKEVWENRREVSEDLDKAFTTDLFTARAKQWIIDHRQDSPDKPFFMYLAYDTPHAALELPTQRYPKGSGINGGLKWLGESGEMINTAKGEPDSFIHPDYADAMWDHDEDPSTPLEPWPDVDKRYATLVRRIDSAVGDLLQLLKDLKIDKNTLVVFTSDNGVSNESYIEEKFNPSFFRSFGPHDGIKRDMLEGGLRVGALVWWPGKIEAGISEEPNAFWDWMPTFAQIAELLAPANTDGVSLLPTLLDEGNQMTSRLYFEYYHRKRTPEYEAFGEKRRGRLRGEMQVIGLGDHMAVRYNIESAEDPFELYNVVTDPKQRKNLAKDPLYSGLLESLRKSSSRIRIRNASAPRPYDEIAMSAVEVSGLESGVYWRLYDETAPWVARMEPASARTHGISRRINTSIIPQNRGVQVLFAGFLQAPESGTYTFKIRTDGNALLRIHEAVVIDADYGYESGTMKTGNVNLEKGIHPFYLSYRHGRKNEGQLEFKWDGGTGVNTFRTPNIFYRETF